MAEIASDEELKSVPVHRALNRPELYQFWNCDREILMSAGLMTVMCVVIGQTYFSAAYGVIFWMCAMFALRLMAKADAQLRQVYVRGTVLYQNYYRACSSPETLPRRIGGLYSATLARMADPWKR